MLFLYCFICLFDTAFKNDVMTFLKTTKMMKQVTKKVTKKVKATKRLKKVKKVTKKVMKKAMKKSKKLKEKKVKEKRAFPPSPLPFLSPTSSSIFLASPPPLITNQKHLYITAIQKC